MGNHEEPGTPIAGGQVPQHHDQDTATCTVSAASKADLEHDETSYPTCLPGIRHPAQCIYTVDLGIERRRVWSLSDQMTMHLNDPEDPKDWEKQVRFWNSHIDFDSVDDIAPKKAFGSECCEEDYPSKYPPTELLRIWYLRHCEGPQDLSPEADIPEPLSAHTENDNGEESGTGTSLSPQSTEFAKSTSEFLKNNEVVDSEHADTKLPESLPVHIVDGNERKFVIEAGLKPEINEAVAPVFQAIINNENGYESETSISLMLEDDGAATSTPENIKINKATDTEPLEHNGVVPAIEVTTPSADTIIHDHDDSIRTGGALASELEQPNPKKNGETSKPSSETHPNTTVNSEGEDNHMDRSGTYLKTFDLAEEQSQAPQLDGTTAADQEEDGSVNQSSTSKRRRKKKNKSTSEAAVQPVVFDGPWAFVLRELIPIANEIRSGNLNIYDRDSRLIGFHSLILRTLRNIGLHADKITEFADVAYDYGIVVRLNEDHFIQAAQTLICLGGRPGGTQEIEKLLTEKDCADLEKFQGSLLSHCRANGFCSEWEFFRTKTQHWAPVIWYWVLRSSCGHLFRLYKRISLNSSGSVSQGSHQRSHCTLES
ncbi:hypothetical protein BKA65DRAFT_161519 [Rhexocercosporidium sp. MPI-PUGE-AT-0058]|nr:hypothetical protein BKA65DRAFT_161519 [Rhexocercosporidium sp. MPI-PUGE-AT-0058]